MSERRSGKGQQHRADHPLSIEDRILWNKVARTVNPLDRERNRAAQQEVWAEWVADAFGERDPPRPAKLPSARPQPATPVSREPRPPTPRHPPKRSTAPAPLEQPAWRKLARGRMPIDASIDLHHLTQDEAQAQLHRFLIQARARDCRHVLVVTGKGRSPASEGVLRRMLPIWLSSDRFAGLVSGVRTAGRGHGGDGAFYVRLRKTRDHHGPKRP